MYKQGQLLRISVPEYDKGLFRLVEVSSGIETDDGYTLYFGSHGELFRSTEIVDVIPFDPTRPYGSNFYGSACVS